MCWEDRAWVPWSWRLLQSENSQAWQQLCDPIPGQVAVGRKVLLPGEIHGGAEEVWNVVPGETGESVVLEKCSPLGPGRAVFLLMEWLGLAWRGPGDSSQGWSCSRELLVLDNPTLPKGEAFQGRFHQSRGLELLPALIQSRWTLSFGAGRGGQCRAQARSPAPGKRDSEGGTAAPWDCCSL